MEPTAWLPAIAIAGFAAASFFCSLAETSLLSLSRWQVGQLAERASARGGMVALLLAKPQDLLATIVLGNTLAFAGLVVVSLWLALHGLWPWWLAIVTPLLLALLVAEVLPKTLAVRRAERWALRVARPMHWLVRLTRPCTRRLSARTRLLCEWRCNARCNRRGRSPRRNTMSC